MTRSTYLPLFKLPLGRLDTSAERVRIGIAVQEPEMLADAFQDPEGEAHVELWSVSEHGTLTLREGDADVRLARDQDPAATATLAPDRLEAELVTTAEAGRTVYVLLRLVYSRDVPPIPEWRSSQVACSLGPA